MEYYTKRIADRLWSQERLELNDCFYRNLHKYEYILIVDIDEVVVPINGDNWTQMIEDVHTSDQVKSEVASYIMHGAKVYGEQAQTEEPDQLGLSVLAKLSRGNISRANPKCFHSTRRVVIVDNHMPRMCFDKCENHLVNYNRGYFLHFRGDLLKTQNTTFDSTLLKYKNRLERNVIEQLNKIYT